MTIKGGKRSSHGSEIFVDGIAVAIAEPIGKGDDAVSTATDDTAVSSEAAIEFDAAKRGKGDLRSILQALCLAFSLFALLVLAMANDVVKLPSCLTTPGITKSLTFVGRWTAVDLAQGGDPGAPDEEIVEISETTIEFVNGGGGFANGPYSPDGSGSYTATQGEESIKFERDGDRLKVTFAGGGYGDAVTVYYNKEVHPPRNDAPRPTTPGITKYVTFVGGHKLALMLTTDEIQETSDFDAKCKSEYGPSARVADWSYDLLPLDEDQVDEMIAVLDVAQTSNEKYYYVSNGGDKYFGGDNRAYFFENHGGNPPGNWLVHDQLGDITLGSWYGITGQVLCIQEITPDKSSMPTLTLVGRWTAVDLVQGRDPGAPDEEIVEISETAIEFVNGGGGFANGPYSLDGSGSYTATQGEESIKFERDGERLKVTFAGGGYGDAVTVYYNKEVDLPRNDPPSLTVSEITKYATFVGRNRVTLMLTTDEIQETSDFDAKCKSEYGPSARVADWSYDLLALDEDQVNEMIAVLDIAQTFNEKHYYVSNGGDKYFGGDTRAYFFENHGGNPPGNWLVHDQLGDITLGSWYGITGQVLCIQE